MEKLKILFLAANPTDTSYLRLSEEVRAIDEELQKARFRDYFYLYQKHAVTAEELSQYLLQVEPDIVHFSGHGSRAGQIYLESNTGKSQPVGVRALGYLFSILKANIRCVVLNACYSEVQALIISRYIDCVIGMSKGIEDRAAINFAQGFYRGIGWGKDLETAFKLGCAQIDLQDLNEEDTPKLIWKNDEPQKIIFSQKAKTVSKSVVSSIRRIEDISPQLESVITEKEHGFPKVHRAAISRSGSDIVSRVDGREIQRITADQLKDLPESQLRHIMVYEKSMEVQYELWEKLYPRRNASPDPLVNAKVEKQLKEIVSTLKNDLNGILSFLESCGMYLSGHYMHIRDLINRA